MKKVIARLNPLYGPRFPFGREAKGMIVLIENTLRGNITAHVSISTSTQLLATDLWCKHQKYELVVIDEQGHKFENLGQAHQMVNKEYISLDLLGIDNFSVDINE